MPKRQTRLDIAKDQVFDHLEGLNPSDDDYTTSVNNLKTLHQLEPEPNRVNVNTLLTVLSYVGVSGGLMALEVFGHAITSRVPNLSLPKPRI